jgi:hypothetical protein
MVHFISFCHQAISSTCSQRQISCFFLDLEFFHCFELAVLLSFSVSVPLILLPLIGAATCVELIMQQIFMKWEVNQSKSQGK